MSEYISEEWLLIIAVGALLLIALLIDNFIQNRAEELAQQAGLRVETERHENAAATRVAAPYAGDTRTITCEADMTADEMREEIWDRG